MPQGEEKIRILENKFKFNIMQQTNSKGQVTLKSQLTALQDDFESLKTLLRDASIQLGESFSIIFEIFIFLFLATHWLLCTDCGGAYCGIN